MARIDTLPKEARIEASKAFNKRQKDLSDYHEEMANPETKLSKQDFDDWFLLIHDVCKTSVARILAANPE